MFVSNNQIPIETAEKLDQLREEFKGRSMAGEVKCRWWGQLAIEVRQTLCVLADCEDGSDFAGRHWMAISIDNREKLAACAMDWARMMQPMRYACSG